MSKLNRKVLPVALFSLMYGFTSLILPTVASANNDDPSIKEITKRTSTSITLPIKYEEREGDRVAIRVSIQNMKTGEKFIRTYKKTLSDDEGRKKLVIKGLNPGTEYKFKIKIRKAGGGDYSDPSDPRKATTKSK